jgi:hypothetical protein
VDSLFEKPFVSVGVYGLLVAGGMCFYIHDEGPWEVWGAIWKSQLAAINLVNFLCAGTRFFKAAMLDQNDATAVRDQSKASRRIKGKCYQAASIGDVSTLRAFIDRLEKDVQQDIITVALRQAVLHGYEDTLSWSLESELFAFLPLQHSTLVELNEGLPVVPFLTMLVPLVCGHAPLAQIFLRRFPNEMRAHLKSENSVVNFVVYLAAWKGHLTTLEWLERHGFVDQTIAATAGQNLPPAVSGMPPTPFFAACQYGHVSCCTWLYEHGAQDEPGGPNVRGFNPLYLACQNGSLETVKFVFAHGGRRNVRTICEGGGTPVMIAVEMGNLDVLAWLLENDWGGCRADISQAGDQGCTPFFAAVQRGHLKTGKYLLKSWPELVDIQETNHAGFTPLHAAAERGHLRVVTWLVSLVPRADLCERSRARASPLMLCIQTLGRMEIARHSGPAARDVAEQLQNAADIVGPCGKGHRACIKLLMTRGGGKGIGKLLLPVMEMGEMTPMMSELFFPHPAVRAVLLDVRAFAAEIVASYARYQYFCVCLRRRSTPYFEIFDREAYLFVRLAVRGFLVPSWPECGGDLLDFLDAFEEHRMSAKVWLALLCPPHLKKALVPW